jgi:hypothetical protein
MNKEVLDHIENAVNEVRTLFTRAADIIETIKPGERIPVTKLADILAKDNGEKGASIYPMLKILTDTYPNTIVKRGAHGGIERLMPTVTAVDNSAVPENKGD